MNPRALVCVVPTSPRLASRGRGHAHGGGWDFIGEEVKKKKKAPPSLRIGPRAYATEWQWSAWRGVAWAVGPRPCASRPHPRFACASQLLTPPKGDRSLPCASCFSALGYVCTVQRLAEESLVICIHSALRVVDSHRIASHRIASHALSISSCIMFQGCSSRPSTTASTYTMQ